MQFEFHDLPALEEIVPQKNEESWFPEDDDESDRPVFSIKKCPFTECSSECSKISWEKANCWSVESWQKVVKYCIHHGMQSSYHNLSKEDAYQQFSLCFESIELHSDSDTFADRQSYRRSVEGSRRSQKRSRAEIEPSDSASNVGSTAAVQSMIDNSVRTALNSVVQHIPSLAVASSSSASPWQGITDAPTVNQLSLVGGSETVEVPIEKLRLIQNSLERAEHAVSASLMESIKYSQNLKGERAILHSALQTISKFTGDEPNLFNVKK